MSRGNHYPAAFVVEHAFGGKLSRSNVEYLASYFTHLAAFFRRNGQDKWESAAQEKSQHYRKLSHLPPGSD